MLHKKKIHLLECQFNQFGAMSSDQKDINEGLKNIYNLKMLNFTNPKLYDLIKVIKKIPKDDIIIFLSIRISLLFLISFIFNRKFGCIYHFIPRKRLLAHKIMIRFMPNILFGTHSFTLKKILENKMQINNVNFIPNCLIKPLSSKLKKIKKKKHNFFILKYEKNKNYKINLYNVIKNFENNGILVGKIYIQGNDYFKESFEEYKNRIILLNKYINYSSYVKILNNSHYLIKFWDKEYETRCSSTILDCIKNNIIFFSNSHPINIQYGLNKTLVVNKITKYTMGEIIIRQTKFKQYYPAKKKFHLYWIEFIKNLT